MRRLRGCDRSDLEGWAGCFRRTLRPLLESCRCPQSPKENRYRANPCPRLLQRDSDTKPAEGGTRRKPCQGTPFRWHRLAVPVLVAHLDFSLDIPSRVNRTSFRQRIAAAPGCIGGRGKTEHTCASAADGHGFDSESIQDTRPWSD